MFCEESSGKHVHFMRSSHIQTHTPFIRDRPTHQSDHERFRNGSVDEFHSLKALKTMKEVPEYTLRRRKKLKNVHEQNFDGEANDN